MTKDEKITIINDVRRDEFSDRASEFQALEDRFGEGVSETILKTRAERIKKEWEGIAKRHGSNDIQGLLDTLWSYVEAIGFEYTYKREGNKVIMNVTKCPIADMAIELDKADWGFKCYCMDDYSICEGFNKSIQFSRTRTLMEGHECCDHTYTL